MGDRFNTANTSASKDEWLTPPELIKALGEFDLDPCAPVKRPWDMAKKHYTIQNDGLIQPWGGRVWLNPPYGRETFKWLARLAEHKSGIALIFARTDTKGFHQHIFRRARSVFFLEGRIQFYHVSGKIGQRPNAPSCLVAYSDADTKVLEWAALKGRLVHLGNGYADEPYFLA